jgi:hypothetical protein
MSAFAKFYVALTATVALVVTLTLDGNVSVQDAVAIGASLFGAAGVFCVPNKPASGDDDGSVDVVTILVVIALLLGIVFLWRRV